MLEYRSPRLDIVVRRWIGTCSVTEELKAGGTDDVCKWWLVSTSADLLIRNAGHIRIPQISTTPLMVTRIPIKPRFYRLDPEIVLYNQYVLFY